MRNSNAIEVARMLVGLPKGQLAEELGITRQHLNRLSTGRSELTPGMLENLSRVLDMPKSFFANDARPLATEGVSFRSLTSLSAKERDFVLGVGATAAVIGGFLDTEWELPDVELTDMDEFDAELAGEIMRREWHLGDDPVPNVTELLEDHGVVLFELPPASRSVGACSFWEAMPETGRRPFVAVNTDQAGQAVRWDCAHELGHLALHQTRPGRGKPAERDANRFAAGFLLPASAMRQVLPEELNLWHLVELSVEWGVPVGALVRRGYELGIYSEWTYRTTFQELAQRGWRLHEPDPTEVESSTLFTELADGGLVSRDVVEATGVRHDLVQTLTWSVLPLASGSPLRLLG